ncbi:hypothetical protein SLA_7119 [Streptomyces laurentii]|uniref:Uncharacterized protein n=1 Tax=Streptomyces laurentii TaxID=39478 RepID=A0A160P9G5_STRLU|nr:hypothetical protein SLA_7119 [Streptomyces laurentii]
MLPRPRVNWWPPAIVGQGMRIDEQHIAAPGLVVLDITAADEDTLHAVMDALQQRWKTSGIMPVRRVPGEPGVRARVYAHFGCER